MKSSEFELKRISTYCKLYTKSLLASVIMQYTLNRVLNLKPESRVLKPEFRVLQT